MEIKELENRVAATTGRPTMARRYYESTKENEQTD
jgi:hypothetical protein